MKNLLHFLAFVLMVGVACAQSNLSAGNQEEPWGNIYSQSKLPACQGEPSQWTNCYGVSKYGYAGEYKDGVRHGNGKYTSTWGLKETYIGQFMDGKYHGFGTLYDVNRNIVNSGIWVGGNFSHSLYVQQLPKKNYSAEIENQLRLPQEQQQSNNSDCTDSIKLIFEGMKVRCLSSFPLLNEEKTKSGFVIGSLAKQNPVFSYARHLSSKVIGVTWNYSPEELNDAKAIEICNENLKIRFKDLSFKKIDDLSCELILSAKAPLGSLKVNLSELDFEKYFFSNPLANVASSSTLQQIDKITNNEIQKRIALVVGNSNYKTRPLRNPRNDADDISRTLRSSGFEVIDLRDGTLNQMRASVRQFGDRLINNDVGLVYYSGHGVEVKGRNYFIPVNADIMREDEIADQGLDVSLILEKMNTAGKGVNILIVDACRDDPFGRSFRSSSRGLAQMDAPRGTIIAYATSPGKVAADGDRRNSPYTKNLVKAMQQPNKPIEQVFKEVRRAVQEETKNQQTPWENTSLSGDFYFKVKQQ